MCSRMLLELTGCTGAGWRGGVGGGGGVWGFVGGLAVSAAVPVDE